MPDPDKYTHIPQNKRRKVVSLPPQVIATRERRAREKPLAEQASKLAASTWELMIHALTDLRTFLLLMVLFSVVVPVAVATPASRSRTSPRGDKGPSHPLVPIPPLTIDPTCRYNSTQAAKVAQRMNATWTNIQIDIPALRAPIAFWTKTPNSGITIDCAEQLRGRMTKAYYHKENYIGLFYPLLAKREVTPLLREELFHAMTFSKFGGHTLSALRNPAEIDAYEKLCSISYIRMFYLRSMISHRPEHQLNAEDKAIVAALIEPDYYQQVLERLQDLTLFVGPMPVQGYAKVGQKLQHEGYPIRIATFHDRKQREGEPMMSLVTAEVLGTNEERMRALTQKFAQKVREIESGYYRTEVTSGKGSGELNSYYVGELFANEDFAKTILPELYKALVEAFAEPSAPEKSWYETLMDYLPEGMCSQNSQKRLEL